jgi:hypothetical protein
VFSGILAVLVASSVDKQTSLSQSAKYPKKPEIDPPFSSFIKKKILQQYYSTSYK